MAYTKEQIGRLTEAARHIQLDAEHKPVENSKPYQKIFSVSDWWKMLELELLELEQTLTDPEKAEINTQLTTLKTAIAAGKEIQEAKNPFSQAYKDDGKHAGNIKALLGKAENKLSFVETILDLGRNGSPAAKKFVQLYLEHSERYKHVDARLVAVRGAAKLTGVDLVEVVKGVHSDIAQLQTALGIAPAEVKETIPPGDTEQVYQKEVEALQAVQKAAAAKIPAEAFQTLLTALEKTHTEGATQLDFAHYTLAKNAFLKKYTEPAGALKNYTHTLHLQWQQAVIEYVAPLTEAGFAAHIALHTKLLALQAKEKEVQKEANTFWNWLFSFFPFFQFTQSPKLRELEGAAHALREKYAIQLAYTHMLFPNNSREEILAASKETIALAGKNLSEIALEEKQIFVTPAITRILALLHKGNRQWNTLSDDLHDKAIAYVKVALQAASASHGSLFTEAQMLAIASEINTLFEKKYICINQSSSHIYFDAPPPKNEGVFGWGARLASNAVGAVWNPLTSWLTQSGLNTEVDAAMAKAVAHYAPSPVPNLFRHPEEEAIARTASTTSPAAAAASGAGFLPLPKEEAPAMPTPAAPTPSSSL